MGIMTEVFVARPEDAEEYDPESAVGDRVQLGGLTSLQFETLWAILDGKEDQISIARLEPVADSDEGPWIHRFPAPYLELLDGLGKAERRSAAKAWAATEEMSASAAEALPIIDQLVTLTKTARQQGCGVFLWVSL